MREVIVYLEGPSDQIGMRRLLSQPIERGAAKGNMAEFYYMGGKERLLNNGPRRAVNILRNKPNSWVFLVPDLYPPNKPFPHSSYQEMKSELENRFFSELQRKLCDKHLRERFRVHCFKYDLEVLLLASESVLMKRLGASELKRSWTTPVEDQDHHQPPKRIVEALFADAGMKYRDTNDVPWILERSDYFDLQHRCPQNFKPFLEDLLALLEQE
ncbi:MAG: DUF4276 family protein [Proteobacteria bacterium]|nr:DUF4276 family protein [Pseudomonadota bacterium]MBU1904287.1 DUF4276 family protein [Pseudomonadota bacterium]